MDEIKDVEIEEEKPKPRKIYQIIDLPYSEMTDEEIELLTEYKIKNAIEADEHKHKLEAITEGIKESAKIQEELAQESRKLLHELTAHAINRFNEVSNNG